MHTLIVGRSESGKTTLAKILAMQAESEGRSGIILDPLQSSDWGRKPEFVSSADEMIEKAMAANDKLLVVDEAFVALDRYDKSQEWLTKQSRHWGHATILVGHGYTDVSLSIRSMCQLIFVMGCSRKSAQMMSDEFDDDKILQATKLPIGHFVMINLKAPANERVKFGHIDHKKRKIFLDNASTQP